MSTPVTGPRADLLSRIMLGLRETSGLAVFFSQAIAERMSVNQTDLEALEFLLRLGPMTAGGLAGATGLTTGAITGVVDRLERRDLAQRTPDPTDRRRVVVSAKPGPALDAMLGAYAAMETATRQLVDGYQDEELAILARFIEEAVAVAKEQIAAVRAGAPSTQPVAGAAGAAWPGTIASDALAEAADRSRR